MAYGRVPCVIAGHRPPAALLARAGEQVRVLASLPDAAALWRQVRVSAAPLRFGAGIKGKVMESLAVGIPCVCAPLAAEGIALPESLLAAARRRWRSGCGGCMRRKRRTPPRPRPGLRLSATVTLKQPWRWPWGGRWQ